MPTPATTPRPRGRTSTRTSPRTRPSTSSTHHRRRCATRSTTRSPTSRASSTSSTRSTSTSSPSTASTSTSASSSSDEGPRRAVPVAGHGQAAGEEHLGAAVEGVELLVVEQGREAFVQRALVELADHAAHVVGGLGREPLPGILPDDGAQLVLVVEAEPVVDADDHVVGLVVQAVAALAIGVVGQHVEPCELTEAVDVVVAQREEVLVGIVVDVALDRTYTQRAVAQHGERHDVPAE